MGKNRKKRKTNSVSDTSIEPDPTPAVSGLLNEANQVLYGNVDEGSSGSSGSDEVPPRPEISTPLPSTTYGVDGKQFVMSIAILNKKMDSVLEQLKKLDVIEAKMDKLETKGMRMETRVTVVEKKNIELENSVSFVSGKFDNLQTKCKEIDTVSSNISTTVKHQEQIIEKLSEDVSSIRNERDNLKESVTDLQCRSMKNNLIFSGLGGEDKYEDTESKLRDFIFYELGIEERIQFGNVHRFGRFVRGKHRPIVARFIYFNDLKKVKESAYKLKGSNFGIGEQYPAVIEDRRKALYPVMKESKKAGDKAKLVRDKLYINGKLYVPDTASQKTPTDHTTGTDRQYSDVARGGPSPSGNVNDRR